MDQSNSQLLGVLGLSGTCFLSKLLLPLRGSPHPRNTLPRAKSTHYPKRHLDRFSCFCMGPKCCDVPCIVNGEENPQNCPFSLGFRHPVRKGLSHGQRQHAQKVGKHHACGSGDILADRQTDRQTHRRVDHNTSRDAEAQRMLNISYHMVIKPFLLLGSAAEYRARRWVWSTVVRWPSDVYDTYWRTKETAPETITRSRDMLCLLPTKI